MTITIRKKGSYPFDQEKKGNGTTLEKDDSEENKSRLERAQCIWPNFNHMPNSVIIHKLN
jgi:hypothetical protein